MTEYEYDYSDPKIRDMIDDDHRPTQTWVGGGTPAGVPTCLTCGADWPCPPELGARDWRLAHDERRAAELRERLEKRQRSTAITEGEIESLKWGTR